MLEIRPLSPSLAKRAEKELGENPSQIENCVKELREWIFQQPHLKARTGRWFLFYQNNFVFNDNLCGTQRIEGDAIIFASC